MREVDVRDMSCAQALALVAKAAEKLSPGETLDVQFSTDDVRSDLIVWALGKRVDVRDATKDLLRLSPMRGAPQRT